MTVRHVLLGCSAGPGQGGGILSYVADLCRALHARGVRVSMVSPPPLRGDWRAHGVTDWIRAGQDEDPAVTARTILAFVRDRAVDGILNNDHPYLQAIAPLSPVPFVAVVHFPRFAIRALALWNHAAADYTVPISGTMAAMLRERFHVPAERSPLIHTGIAPDLLGIERAKPEAGKRKAVFLGGWVGAKGGDLVRELARAPSPCWASWQIAWFGTLPAPQQRELAALPHVTLHGMVPREQVIRELAAAELLLFPSREEGCPMALLEGMALGAVPLAASASGAMAEIVQPGRNGYLWPLERWVPESLTLLTALAGPGVAPDLAEAARARVRESFLIDHCAEKLLALLDAPKLARPLARQPVPALDWHRRTGRSGGKGRLIDRLRYRLGWLRTAGMLAA